MKFSFLHGDINIQKIQQEVEDNLVDQSDLSVKSDKVKSFQKTEPNLTDLADGDAKGYDDGTNQWLYLRIAAKLWKFQLTEV